SSLRSAWVFPGTRRVLSLIAPAVLGVSVAQISLLINTQIASHLTTGSVSWLTYADRLMEFPTAMLGVALGVVLLPQLSGARGADDGQRYSNLLDWGLRLVVLLAVPCAVALLVFAQPLVAVLYHRGAFTDFDAFQTTVALQGYGVGLLGLVAIKVLAPGFYARQDTKTPVKIAVAVLVLTQILNVFLVPHLAHAALTLSISIGALVNATWLLVGLLRRGAYTPTPGWWRFGLQVVLASSVMAAGLVWATAHFDWLAMKDQSLMRFGLLCVCIVVAALVYFACLAATGVKLRQFARR
ncbi:MAG: murein biosynthesis integral membrane protein MurJ, partial [Hydrogenophaga sp.]